MSLDTNSTIKNNESTEQSNDSNLSNLCDNLLINNECSHSEYGHGNFSRVFNHEGFFVVMFVNYVQITEKIHAWQFHY